MNEDLQKSLTTLAKVLSVFYCVYTINYVLILIKKLW